jgi:glycosyltransferase involved in cell wall biosynthesis
MTPVSSKRLVIFIHSMGGGGAERVTTNLVNYWVGKGWEVTVVTLAPRSVDFYKLHSAVKRISLDLASDSGSVVAGLWWNLRRVLAMRRVLREIEPDIALGMMTTANVLLALAKWGLPKLRAIGAEHVHPPQYPLSGIWEWLRSRMYGQLDAMTALTRESADWLMTHSSARSVTVIPNAAPWPLPEEFLQLSPDSFCAAERHLLLAIGRLEVQKGFDRLIESFAALAKKHADWDLVILGEGSLRTKLERQTQAAGLAQRVLFPGRVGNPGSWYERADLYVMSSRFEGFGNTLAEALTYGLPVVSFDCDTGPRDIIRHELDGLLVLPGDLEALTEALDRLMSDGDLRRRYGARAVEARERFSVEKIAGMWESLFEEVRK